MAQAFESQRDVQRRLDDTICFYKNKPVWCAYVGGNMFQLFSFTPKGGANDALEQHVDYTDPDFSYTIPTIGYVNSDKRARYLKRVPLRNQRYGLPIDALRWSDQQNLADRNSIVGNDYVAKMLMNDYPSLEEAMRLVSKGKRESCAFCKQYAVAYLDGGFRLAYKGKYIADLVKNERCGYEVVWLKDLAKPSFFMRHFGDRYYSILYTMEHVT